MKRLYFKVVTNCAVCPHLHRLQGDSGNDYMWCERGGGKTAEQLDRRYVNVIIGDQESFVQQMKSMFRNCPELKVFAKKTGYKELE